MQRRASTVLLAVLCLGLRWSSPAQIPKIDLKSLKSIPGLAEILKSPPALTTTFADAVTDVPFLDDFDPAGAYPMGKLPRTPEGGFVLDRPGVFLFECQSYCVGPGKHAPGGNSAYLFAPLQGPRADMVRTVIRKSWAAPDIPQRDVQVLLWAIVSRTKFADLGRDRRETAARLLTPQQILELDGGALGLIPENIKNEALKHLPPAVRQTIVAEERLRRQLSGAKSTYEALERIAVPPGSAPRNPQDRVVPRERWSLHPDGYFLRFAPRTYKKLRIEICRPEPVRIRRDERARIVGISDSMGNRLEVEYDDGRASLKLAGEASLEGFAFRSVRFEGADFGGPEDKPRAEWSGKGWTFLGIPSGGGSVPVSAEPFLRAPERYEWAKKHLQDLEILSDGLKKVDKRPAPQGFSATAAADIVALGHFTAALRDIIPPGYESGKFLAAGPLELCRKAWLSAVVGGLGNLPNPPVFDPAEDPQPSRSGEQPNGGSGRGTDQEEECARQFDLCMEKAEKDLNERIKNCLERESFDRNLCNAAAIAQCLREIYFLRRDSSTLRQCIMDACGGGGPAYDCIRKAAASYYIRTMQCTEAYKKCTGN